MLKGVASYIMTASPALAAAPAPQPASRCRSAGPLPRPLSGHRGHSLYQIRAMHDKFQVHVTHDEGRGLCRRVEGELEGSGLSPYERPIWRLTVDADPLPGRLAEPSEGVCLYTPSLTAVIRRETPRQRNHPRHPRFPPAFEGERMDTAALIPVPPGFSNHFIPVNVTWRRPAPPQSGPNRTPI